MSSPVPPPAVGDRDPNDRVQWSAVLIGVSVDFFATIAATMLVYSMAAGIAGSRGSQGGAEAYIEQLQGSPDFIVAFALAGLLCVSFGGFVAARRAGYAHLRHAILVGVGSLTLTLLMEQLFAGEPDPSVWSPAWFRMLGFLLVIPFAALGGVFAERISGEPDDLLPG